jgi:hypothetical protein
MPALIIHPGRPPKYSRSGESKAYTQAELHCDAVKILQGSDDPLIEPITAYVRWYKQQVTKAKRSEVEDPRFDPAAAPPPSSRRTYRRF